MSALRQRSLRIRAQTDASPNHQGTGEHAYKDGNGHIQHRQHPHLHQRQIPTIGYPRTKRVKTKRQPREFLRAVVRFQQELEVPATHCEHRIGPRERAIDPPELWAPCPCVIGQDTPSSEAFMDEAEDERQEMALEVRDAADSTAPPP